MGIHEELERLGFELQEELGSSEDRTEVWISRRSGMGVSIEWFRLREVRR
jgi:hypothetical protein